MTTGRPDGQATGRSLRGSLVDAGPCPYLPDRQFHAFHVADPVDDDLYRALLDNRFRRNGAMFYVPMCPACSACQPIRVAVDTFAPRRDQRRVLQRNHDLRFAWQARGCDDERTALWGLYQSAIHDDHADDSPKRFMTEDVGISGGELHARDAAGRLIGVAMCDVVGDAWSSIYCYWHPDEQARGLGTALAMAEIAMARDRGIRWWYPGFWVAGCAKMTYKARFGPAEVLVNGTWIPLTG